MNAEQLHNVSIELQGEIRTTGILNLLEQLSNALQQTIQQPGQPQFQEQVSEFRGAISEALKKVVEQERPISKQIIIEEIGGSGLLGAELLETIEDSFLQQEVTPSLVKQDIDSLKTKLQNFDAGLSEFIAAFKKFGIKPDILEPFQAELGVLVPRRDNQEDLISFSKDIAKLSEELNWFHELVTGQSDNFRIRSMSSSDFQLFVELLPQTAEAVVITIAALAHAYEKLLNIRIKMKELRDQEAPKDVTDAIDTWAEGLMEDKINEISSELIEQFSNVDRPEGRINEVEGGIKLSIKRIAGRLDVGYHFTARIGDIPDDKGAKEEEQKEKREIVKNIKTSSSQMDYGGLPGDPILPIAWHPESNESRQDKDDGESQS